MTHNLGMAPYRLPGPGICPPDFKPPSESPQIPSAPNPKKRRKTSSAASNQMPSQPPPSPQDLLPPPLTGYGDTIVASNPFDDTPTNTSMSHTALGHMNMHGGGMNPHMHLHMGGPPMRGMSPLGMGNMSPMGNMGPMGPGSMQCGGPIPHMNSRGGMSPMGGMPGATMGGMSPMGSMGPSISPMGPMGGLSPMGGPPNSHMGMNPNMGPNGSRSIGSPMSGGPIGSPMNSLPMGSPMGNAMGSPLGGGPGHINNGQMGPPMHSPLGNGPSHSHMSGPRMNVPNGAMTSTGGPMPHQMNPMVAGGPNNPMTSSAQMTTTNSMNTMGGTIGGHSPMNHQNVPMTQGGPMNSGHVGNPMNSNMSHGMSMGPMGPSHLAHMGHMGGPGGGGGGPMNGPPNSMSGMYGPKPMPVSAGKVYPPGQAMVFNPQNPNAPPIYPCGLCHKEVNDNDEALFCESGCNFFFHRTCSGLTEAAFQLISKEIFAEWCCDKCLSSKTIPMVKFKC